MNEQTKSCLEEATKNMISALSFFEKSLEKIRAGKANPIMLQGVKVDYYGSPTPVENVANISTPDPRQIVIQPWEKSMLPIIEKAVLAANLGFSPQIDGAVLRLGVPILTEERRKELVKRAQSEGESSKINIRNARRNVLDKIKKLKDNGVSEDEIKQAEKTLQETTDRYIKEVDGKLALKEKEIMEV